MYRRGLAVFCSFFFFFFFFFLENGKVYRRGKRGRKERGEGRGRG